MKLENRKILVTGAGGFIGSHLTEQLVRMGCRVKGFVHYNSFNRWGWLDSLDSEIMNEVEVFTGDVRDSHGVKTAMKGCSMVLHLAALIGIPYSYHSPDTYVDTNVKGTLNVLQAARELEVEKIVHTSTSETYGTAQFVPITEKHPVNPQSPYAATKAGADYLSLTFHRSFGLPVTVLRPFNTFGPRQSARAVIPTIITQAASGINPILLGALHPTRDLTYVEDTAYGFICAATSDKGVGQVINLGTNREISIGNLAGKILAIMGNNAEIKQRDERMRPKKSEVERLWSDPSLAEKLIGWKAQFTLEEGLKKTIKWFTHGKNLGYYKADVYNI